MVRDLSISIGGWRHEGVSLPHVLKSGKVLQIPRHVQSAHAVIPEGDYMIDMKAGRARDIDVLDRSIIAGKAGTLDVRLARGNVVSVALGVGILPSPLGLQVALSIGGLPRFGSLIRLGGGLGIVETGSSLNLTAGSAIVFLPVSGSSIATFDAGSIRCLSDSIMPKWAWLAGVKSLESEASCLTACHDIHHGTIASAQEIANGEFIFERIAA